MALDGCDSATGDGEIDIIHDSLVRSTVVSSRSSREHQALGVVTFLLVPDSITYKLLTEAHIQAKGAVQCDTGTQSRRYTDGTLSRHNHPDFIVPRPDHCTIMFGCFLCFSEASGTEHHRVYHAQSLQSLLSVLLGSALERQLFCPKRRLSTTWLNLVAERACHVLSHRRLRSCSGGWFDHTVAGS